MANNYILIHLKDGTSEKLYRANIADYSSWPVETAQIDMEKTMSIQAENTVFVHHGMSRSIMYEPYFKKLKKKAIESHSVLFKDTMGWDLGIEDMCGKIIVVLLDLLATNEVVFIGTAGLGGNSIDLLYGLLCKYIATRQDKIIVITN